MQKYIAFDLYQKNDQGGHVMAKRTPLTGDEVYLASDVNAELAKCIEVFEAARTQVNNEVSVSVSIRLQALRSLMESVT